MWRQEWINWLHDLSVNKGRPFVTKLLLDLERNLGLFARLWAERKQSEGTCISRVMSPDTTQHAEFQLSRRAQSDLFPHNHTNQLK